MNDEFLIALQAPALAPEIDPADDLYGRLIGSWDAEVVDLDDDGARKVQRAEIHFARILEGRAVQDLWIVPPRSERRPGMPRLRNRYGTTLRVYDPSRKVWRVTWINPVSGTVMELVARRDGDDIVQEGLDAEGQHIRWSFREITSSSFHWVSQRSLNGGQTWLPDTEFSAKRLSQ